MLVELGQTGTTKAIETSRILTSDVCVWNGSLLARLLFCLVYEDYRLAAAVALRKHLTWTDSASRPTLQPGWDAELAFNDALQFHYS